MFEDPNGIKYIGTPAWKTHKKSKAAVEAERVDFSNNDGGAEGHSLDGTEKAGGALHHDKTDQEV